MLLPKSPSGRAAGFSYLNALLTALVISRMVYPHSLEPVIVYSNRWCAVEVHSRFHIIVVSRVGGLDLSAANRAHNQTYLVTLQLRTCFALSSGFAARHRRVAA